MQAASASGLAVPSRRPSRRPSGEAAPVSLRASAGHQGGSGLYDTSSLLQPAKHRAPLHLRLPGLFRTRIPLVAILPFFLLGYLFAPIQQISKDGNGLAALESPRIQSLRDYTRGGFGNRQTPFTGHLPPKEQYTLQDGLLYFPPSAPDNSEEGVEAAMLSLPRQKHPILHLIEKAESEWEDLLSRQSSSLDAAVREYKRRYKRNPPAGFDKWWKFVEENNVQLPDEYDSIHRDMETFFALPPSVFRARVQKLVGEPDFYMSRESFTVNIKDGRLSMTGPHGAGSRAEETRGLVEPIARLLPDMQLVLTAHDGPGVFMTGEAKEKHLRAARSGRFLTESEYMDLEYTSDYPGWQSGCLPGSNWRRSLFGNAIQKPSTHSFVTDVEEAADVCKHPNIGSQHGFFLWTGPGPELLYPLFSWAKTSVHSDILVTPLEQYYLEVGPDPAWEDKQHSKLLWRGSNTGAAFNRESRWRSSQRARLILLSQEWGVDKMVQYADEEGVLRAVIEPQAELNERLLDVAFSGQPAQCDEGDGTCAALRRVFEFKRGMGQEEANQYKYIFDMDGNGWSGRFHRLLSSNSAVLKSTIMPEWYQDRIMPWVHYIPVKVDYTDLYDILVFFIGRADGENGHDHLAKKIAMQGQDWAKHHWREEDMQSYLIRLFLEYGRLLNRLDEDPTSADYVE